MAYKCRGKLGKKIKATEMEANNFSLALLTKKFSDLCQEPVGLQYKGKTLLNDTDVKLALDDCYSQKKLFLEVDLVSGGGGASFQAGAAAAAVAEPAREPVREPVRAAAPVQSPRSAGAAAAPAATVEAAEQLLSKYGLAKTSPRDTPAPASAAVAAATSPRRVQAPEPAHVPAPAVVSPRRAEPARAAVPAAAASSSSDRKATQLEGEARADINRLRTSPASFVDQLERRKQAYEGNVLRLKRGNVMFRSQTHEGAAAVSAAIQYLRSVKATHKLDFCHGLSEASRDIITFMGPDGNRKPSPDDMSAMIDRRGQYEGTLSQVIAYVYEDDVEATILDLLVCDGDASRHTATLLMNPEYRFAGLGMSEPQNGPRLLVMQFVSDSWTDQ